MPLPLCSFVAASLPNCSDYRACDFSIIRLDAIKQILSVLVVTSLLNSLKGWRSRFESLRIAFAVHDLTPTCVGHYTLFHGCTANELCCCMHLSVEWN